MREHKYRGLDIMGNWHYGLIANPKIDIAGGAKKDWWYISNKGGIPFAYEVRQETIGEYTGLNDMNGVEIYEGDIIKTRTESKCECPPKEENLIIKFDPYNAGFCAAEQKRYFGLPISWTGFVHLEVIGNIHQNPELLET